MVLDTRRVPAQAGQCLEKRGSSGSWWLLAFCYLLAELVLNSRYTQRQLKMQFALFAIYNQNIYNQYVGNSQIQKLQLQASLPHYDQQQHMLSI